VSGKFIVLEGVEGVGKSTNMEFIQRTLKAKGIDFEASREPGGTPLAEEVRRLLLEPREETMDNLAELLLVFAARAQHLAQKIKPVLRSGRWLVCDRFTDATYAYQGGGRDMDRQTILQLEKLVQGALRPDLVLLLDLPVSVGLARAKKRSDLDRFEQEQESFFEAVRNAYLERAEQNPSRYRIVDASLPLADVQAQIEGYLDDFIASN